MLNSLVLRVPPTLFFRLRNTSLAATGYLETIVCFDSVLCTPAG